MTLDWLQTAVSALLGTAGVGGIAVFVKARREADGISVKTAEGALIVQERIVSNLEAENKRLHEECKQIQARNDRLVARIKELQGLEPKEGDE